jgi:uncharacterized protein (DUF983 family)
MGQIDVQNGWSVFLSGRRRTWHNHCPQCGTGALFASRFGLVPECGECGLVYRREAGSQTGSMYLSAAITELFAAALCVGIFLLTDWSTAVSISIALPTVLLFSYWFLPKSMGLWVAVEYAADVSNREGWVDLERLERSFEA